MANLEFHTEIHATLEKVYEISQDYAQRYEWDPFPEKIEFLNGATEVALGVKVNVIAKSGLKMIVQFIQVKPPELAAIKMIEGPKVLKVFAGNWLFKPLPNGNTKASFKYTIQAQNWFLPVVSNKIMAWYFGRHVQTRLEGLKRYCEQNTQAV